MPTNPESVSAPAAQAVRATSTGARVIAVVSGAALVALAAQISVPLPGTPVPMTLQPLAVLIVGGLLGAELGAASMILYLAMGATGLPVFTPNPFLPQGLGRLLGPTGGYLIAYPVAAYATGRLAGGGDGRRWLRTALAVLAGMVLIHLGGFAQLMLLTGTAERAAQLGTLPFLLGDVAKLAVASLVISRLRSPIRARL